MSVTGRLPMSAQYRAMTYFVCATLHFYRADLTPATFAAMKPGSLEDRERWFKEHHMAIIRRVADESRNLFGYELSDIQMGKGILAYFAESFKVSDLPPAKLE